MQKQSDLAVEQETITKLRRIRVDQAQKYLFPICKQKVFPEFGTPPDDTPVHFDGTVRSSSSWSSSFV